MSDVRDPIASLGITPELLATRRFRFVEETDRSIVQTVKCGVIYIMAFWSGPARMAFAELKRVLASLDPDGRIELVVIDTDGCPDFYQLPEFPNGLGGWGETIWIRSGMVADVSIGAKEYESKVGNLLAE